MSQARSLQLFIVIRIRDAAFTCFLWIVQSQVVAAPITVYTQASVGLRDCAAECFDSAGDPNLDFVGDQDYEQTGFSSAQIVGSSTGTQSAASAGFGGPSFTPTLSAYSYTSDTFRFTTSAFGLQRYEFTSAGTVTIGGTLTYSQSGIASGPAYTTSPAGRITAQLFTFQMAEDIFNLDSCTVTNQQNILFGKTPALCVLRAGETIGNTSVSLPGRENFQIADFAAGTGVVENGFVQNFLSVTGNAGDIFYLGGSLNSFAHLGGFSDSRNTLKLNFDNPSLVQAAFTEDTFAPAPITAVPEPSSLGLLMFGLMSLWMRQAMRSVRSFGNRFKTRVSQRFQLKIPTHLWRKLALAVLGFGATNVLAVPITNYTQALIHLRDCQGICFDGNDVTVQWVGDEDYGSDGSAQMHVIGPTPGVQSAASAGFSGNAYAPTLSAYAYSNGTYRINGGALGLQRYEFIAPGTVTIEGTVTYSQTGNFAENFGQLPSGDVLAGLFAFQMTNDIFDLDDCSANPGPGLGPLGKNPAICALGIGLAPSSFLPGQYNFQHISLDIGFDPMSGGVKSGSISFTGNAGDVFFLGARLGAIAQLGGFGDSRNTLKVNFDNPTLVRASFEDDTFSPAPIASVPEPGTLALFGLALAGIGIARRRKSA